MHRGKNRTRRGARVKLWEWELAEGWSVGEGQTEAGRPRSNRRRDI